MTNDDTIIDCIDKIDSSIKNQNYNKEINDIIKEIIKSGKDTKHLMRELYIKHAAGYTEDDLQKKYYRLKKDKKKEFEEMVEPIEIEEIENIIKNFDENLRSDKTIEKILTKIIPLGKGMQTYIIDELAQKLKYYKIRVLNSMFTALLKKERYKESEKNEESENSYSLCMEIMEHNEIFCPKEYRNEILVYNNGKYSNEEKDTYLNKVILNIFIEKELNALHSDSELNSKLILIKKYIKAETYCSIHEFDIYNNLINVKNGVLDISDLNNVKLLPHSPEYKIRIQLPINYKPNVKCPLISKQINFVVGNKYKNLIYQNIGDAMIGNPSKYQKMLVLIGKELTGKSSLLNIIRKFLGNENVSGESLHDIQNDPHSMAELENKLSNIYGDLPRKYIKEMDKIKILTGEKYLSGNRKYGNKFQFINHCKNFFSANKLSEFFEPGGDIFRRFLLIPCYNTIEDIIPDFEEQITTEEELSGLLNLALNGLKQLNENNGYDPELSKNIEELWELHSNPLIPFIEKYIDYNYYSGINEEFEIEKDVFFNVFNAYLEKYNIPKIKKTNVLTRRLNSLGMYKIGTRDYTKDTVKYHVYMNIQFNESAIRDFGLDELGILDKGLEREDLYKFLNINNSVNIDEDELFSKKEEDNVF